MSKSDRVPKPTTDSRLSFDIRSFMRATKGQVLNRVLYRWSDDERRGYVPVASLFTLTSPATIAVAHVGGELPGEVLDIVYTPCQFGGKRAWVMCSRIGCGRRAGIVYDSTKGFRCRHCCGLDYRSHRERPGDRLLRKSRRLRAKVGGGKNLLQDFPDRPKGMHWSTYEALQAQEAAIWGGMKKLVPKALRNAAAPL